MGFASADGSYGESDNHTNTYLAVDISKGTHSSLIGQHARSFTEFRK
ncbi:predicted protein [Botrytis cinerea T4]|uniref:Uncharacterized protein n=1 Tax=Botryotinia fuckeliana (strain T4) TaxID=999810 RepID=G2YN73_BOTF4|nr:predicted protein [Botrytis cinerea T4]